MKLVTDVTSTEYKNQYLIVCFYFISFIIFLLYTRAYLFVYCRELKHIRKYKEFLEQKVIHIQEEIDRKKKIRMMK